MTISLLDVNVLIALVDPAHSHHAAASEWFRLHQGKGWATCPITENGFVRIISSRAYPNLALSPSDAGQLLASLKRGAAKTHEFWNDDVSIADTAAFDLTALVNSQQLTDAYLLGLCAAHGGRLVTFDKSMPWRAVVGGRAALAWIVT